MRPYDEKKDKDYREGIQITEGLTINGNGAVIDAGNLARIFNISASGVVLNNLTLINGNATLGGAIYWNATGGKVNRSKFYNNTASVNGSAIYSTNELSIYNSEFLDNLANNTYTLTKSGTNSFNVAFVSGDNNLNAVWAPGTLTINNVTYWNGTTATTSGSVNSTANHVLIVELLDYATETNVSANQSKKTDSNGNISVTGLNNSVYYKVNVYHYTGSSRYSVFSDEFIGGNVTVSKLELIVPDNVFKGDNITVVAIVNDTATGSITFILPTGNKTVNLSGNSASLTIPINSVGNYSIEAVFNSNGTFYGNRNSTSFIVSMPIIPTVIFDMDNSTNPGDFSIVANSNFDARPYDQLQLVDTNVH